MWLFVVNVIVFILYFSVLWMQEQFYDCINVFMIAWKLIRILVVLASFSVLLPIKGILIFVAAFEGPIILHKIYNIHFCTVWTNSL